MTGEREAPIRFDTPEAFRAWLSEHHGTSRGVWLHIARTGSERQR